MLEEEPVDLIKFVIGGAVWKALRRISEPKRHRQFTRVRVFYPLLGIGDMPEPAGYIPRQERRSSAGALALYRLSISH